MKGQESDQNQDIWNLLGGSVDLEAYIGIFTSPSHQEMCGCPMPSAGSPLYLQMETVDVQVVSTWRAVLVAFGSPQIPKRNWRI
jgi:hypothetical protein